MEALPVRLLTELISPEEILAAAGVRATHPVGCCPVGICLPNESNRAWIANEFAEVKHTTRAFYALKVWETARDALQMRPEFVHALDTEWYPIAASFNSIRFVNGFPDKFVACLFDEMKRIADSGRIEVRYGRFDNVDAKEHWYIMPPDIFAATRHVMMKDELTSLQGEIVNGLSWNDIKDTFVVLKPIQLAFIAGGQVMNRHTPLDDEFIHACAVFDYEKVKELVARGANIHAVQEHGNTAMSDMVENYYDWGEEKHGEEIWHAPIFDDRNYDAFVKLAEYLFSLGYNVNLAGYCECTPLHQTNFNGNLKVGRFLLEHGADPNEPSYVGDWGNPLGESTLYAVWEEIGEWPGIEQGKELVRTLWRHGALPVPRDKKMDKEELEFFIKGEKHENRWDTRHCKKLSECETALVNSVLNLSWYSTALLAQSGGNVNLRDDMGRNLLQIALEDTAPYATNSPESVAEFQNSLAEIALLLLCGLKLQLSAAEIAQAKQICESKGYTEVLEEIEYAIQHPTCKIGINDKHEI